MDNKVSEGGGGGVPGAGAQIPQQPVLRRMRQAVLLQPIKVNSGAYIHLQLIEDHMLKQMSKWLHLKNAMREAHNGAVKLGGPSLVKVTHAGAVHEELHLCRMVLWWRSSWRPVTHGRNLTLEQERCGETFP